MLLLVALMLADSLDEALSAPPDGDAALLAQIAERLESLADTLEAEATNA